MRRQVVLPVGSSLQPRTNAEGTEAERAQWAKQRGGVSGLQRSACTTIAIPGQIIMTDYELIMIILTFLTLLIAVDKKNQR